MRIYSNDDEGVILLKLRDLGEYTEENIRSYPRIYKSTPLTDFSRVIFHTKATGTVSALPFAKKSVSFTRAV